MSKVVKQSCAKYNRAYILIDLPSCHSVQAIKKQSCHL